MSSGDRPAASVDRVEVPRAREAVSPRHDGLRGGLRPRAACGPSRGGASVLPVLPGSPSGRENRGDACDGGRSAERFASLNAPKEEVASSDREEYRGAPPRPAGRDFPAPCGPRLNPQAQGAQRERSLHVSTGVERFVDSGNSLHNCPFVDHTSPAGAVESPAGPLYDRRFATSGGGADRGEWIGLWT